MNIWSRSAFLALLSGDESFWSLRLAARNLDTSAALPSLLREVDTCGAHAWTKRREGGGGEKGWVRTARESKRQRVKERERWRGRCTHPAKNGRKDDILIELGLKRRKGMHQSYYVTNF